MKTQFKTQIRAVVEIAHKMERNIAKGVLNMHDPQDGQKLSHHMIYDIEKYKEIIVNKFRIKPECIDISNPTVAFHIRLRFLADEIDHLTRDSIILELDKFGVFNDLRNACNALKPQEMST